MIKALKSVSIQGHGQQRSHSLARSLSKNGLFEKKLQVLTQFSAQLDLEVERFSIAPAQNKKYKRTFLHSTLKITNCSHSL